ncbi:hypothetical protein Poli38472_003254 [Pythium oligandrum]|uniref:Uncharacterized protein n=1 Tax=Pythium oligandrum TaxID=41045 RepID=A0A8K1FDW1_PYTOL|nr:hypothetical protein Poli38472_003254 [Pythium oligandrum]|eukprot:TMW57329.1 hypothetical protein Poli38472_003254 [Pythium oligandrum]
MTDVKKYRFTRADFQPLATKPLHFDMVFDMSESKVKVTLQTTLLHVAAEPLTELKLNSKELEIVSVERFDAFTPLNGGKDFVSHVKSFASPRALEYTVDTGDHFLVVKFAQPVTTGQEFVIRTVSVATPTENILEGLYFDYTPKGAPRTIITQCQQHGFQRIVPCIDTMDAKAYYTTTIVADKRYTNIITNGDLAPGFHDDNGVPIFHPAVEVLGAADESRHALKYYNHTVNMAPYLFFLGVGSYETYRRTLEFPDGDTTLLEILAFPEFFEPVDAKRAVAMLHDSVLWTMVSLGPEACEHHDERKRIYELLEEREALKAKEGPLCLAPGEKYEKKPLSSDDEARLAAVRAELKELLKVWKKTGYKYTGAVYREIAMENSNYGGMENVGNTTIVSSCLCPSCRMDDHSYEYMERVKVHEYYHNINGSQVTGQSPFEIWLNEAVTVHVERMRYGDIFGHDYARLSEVINMFTPAIGPLAQDLSATSLSVEPEGFNQTQELVSVVTYTKSPEFVRMVQLLLGEDKFHKALDKYHTDYSFGNATTMDWIRCMEQFSGLDLHYLAKTWLKRPGHPTVTYSSEYNAAAKEYIVKMSQTGYEDKPADNNGPWEIPVDWSLVKDGKSVKEGVFVFKTKDATLVVSNVDEEPDFLSFARGWSFFGKVKPENVSTETLTKQARADPDAVNKYQAYRTITDIEKARIIEGLLKGDSSVAVSDEWVDLYGSILFSEDLTPSARALTLREGRSIPSRDDLAHHYQAIVDATRALSQAVWAKYSKEIEALYTKICAESRAGPHFEQLHLRSLKTLLLGLINVGAKPPALSAIPRVIPTIAPGKLALELFKTTTFASEKTSAFRFMMNNDTFEDRAKIQKEVFEEWRQHSDTMTNYIGTIASLSTNDVGQEILELLAHPAFNPAQADHGRTLCGYLTQMRHFTLMTDEGLDVLVQVFTTIGKVNQMSVYPLLQSFDHLDRFEGETKTKIVQAIQRMQEAIDPKKEESLYHMLNSILQQV